MRPSAARHVLSCLALAMLVAGLALSPGGASGQGLAGGGPPGAEAVSRTDRLAELINQARVSAGQPPLARSSELDAAAGDHSRDMAEHSYLEHEGLDGSTPQARAAIAGYRVPADSGWLVVELISAISDDAEGPLDWWLGEETGVHRRNLLDPRWREMGVGYASGGEYGNYWTLLLGCRPGVLPVVTLDGVTYRHTEQCDQRSVPPAAGPVTPDPPEARARRRPVRG
jgi:hypothetical protein